MMLPVPAVARRVLVWPGRRLGLGAVFVGALDSVGFTSGSCGWKKDGGKEVSVDGGGS